MATSYPATFFTVFPGNNLKVVPDPRAVFAHTDPVMSFVALPVMQFDFNPFVPVFVAPDQNQFLTSDGEVLTADGENLW